MIGSSDEPTTGRHINTQDQRIIRNLPAVN
jgi:hypothetical protein